MSPGWSPAVELLSVGGARRDAVDRQPQQCREASQGDDPWVLSRKLPASEFHFADMMLWLAYGVDANVLGRICMMLDAPDELRAHHLSPDSQRAMESWSTNDVR